MDRLLHCVLEFEREGLPVERTFYWRIPESILQDREAREESFRTLLDGFQISPDKVIECLLVPVPLSLPEKRQDVRLGFAA